MQSKVRTARGLLYVAGMSLTLMVICGPHRIAPIRDLPGPETPLITARIHDGEAFIAWIDADGRRQERTLTEEEFCWLNDQDE